MITKLQLLKLSDKEETGNFIVFEDMDPNTLRVVLQSENESTVLGLVFRHELKRLGKSL